MFPANFSPSPLPLLSFFLIDKESFLIRNGTRRKCDGDGGGREEGWPEGEAERANERTRLLQFRDLCNKLARTNFSLLSRTPSSSLVCFFDACSPWNFALVGCRNNKKKNLRVDRERNLISIPPVCFTADFHSFFPWNGRSEEKSKLKRLYYRYNNR